MINKPSLFLIFLILAAGVLACRFTGDSPTPIVAPLQVDEPTSIDPSYKRDIRIEVDGRTRLYDLYLPSSYDGVDQIAVVFVLHGGGGNGDQVAKYIGMNALAEEEGFAVVYPDGTGRGGLNALTWNAGHCCGYALQTGVDDVGFLSVLIDELLELHALDPQRIYVTGMSNGGMMAFRAAAELSDKIAAIAPIAGTIGGQSEEGALVISIPRPANPLPVLIFHGQEDKHVLYNGGNGSKTTGTRNDLSVTETVAFWVQANGCSPEPQTEVSANRNIITDTYPDCRQGADVILVTIVDGGHAWPGGDKGRRLGDKPTQDISATEMVWAFFRLHTLDN